MSSVLGQHLAVVCDLDGVVYRGPSAVPHAVAALDAQRTPVVYATNNASRPPHVVAEHLRELGLHTGTGDVVNASQAAAWLLSRHHPELGPVLPIGGPGVRAALEEAGFEVVNRAGSEEIAVVQGYGPAVSAADLAEAAYAVQGGTLWVATNTDSTLPTDRGVAPGNGSLVGAVANAVGRQPDLVAGKPETPIYELCAEQLSCEPADILAIGDRLETDIAGANRLGMTSLLVLTGVDDLTSVALALPALRPTHIAADLRCLTAEDHREAAVSLTQQVRAWWARLDAGSDRQMVVDEIDRFEMARAVAGDR